MPDPFMQRAIDLAVENVQSARGGPFACVIVKDGRILAEGTNLVTTTNDPTAHAEIVAIRAACQTLNAFQLPGCDIYASCEPCPMCLGAIYWARPARLFYAASAADAAHAGFDDSLIYSELQKPPTARRIPTSQLMHEEALAPFRAWLNFRHRVEY